MRILSNFEKKFLKRIVELEQAGQKLLKPHNFLQNILDIKSQVMFVGRSYDYKLKDGENHYYKIEIKGKEAEVSGEYLELTEKLYEANDLMNYLLQNGYLLRHEGGVALGLVINLQEFDESDKKIETINVYIKKPLEDFLEKCAYYYKSTEALRDLVKNDFRTKEERNNQRTRIISIISIIISVVGLAINTYINTSKKESPKQVLEIDSSTVNYIISKVKPPISKVTTEYPDTAKAPLTRITNKKDTLNPQNKGKN